MHRPWVHFCMAPAQRGSRLARRVTLPGGQGTAWSFEKQNERSPQRSLYRPASCWSGRPITSFALPARLPLRRQDQTAPSRDPRYTITTGLLYVTTYVGVICAACEYWAVVAAGCANFAPLAGAASATRQVSPGAPHGLLDRTHFAGESDRDRCGRQGGVGKTTLAYELAYLLEAPLVDLDWDRGGATRQWGYRHEERLRAPLLDALERGGIPRPVRGIRKPNLVPSHPDFADNQPAAEDMADALTKTWSQNLAACRCSWLKRL